MPEAPDLTCRPLIRRPGRVFAGFGAVVGIWAFLTVLLPTERWGKWFVLWMTVGLTVVLTAVVMLLWATAQVRADAYGVHSRMMLRRRSVPWSEVADLHIRLQRVRNGEVRRVDLVLRGGRKLRLPLPQTVEYDDPAFDSEVEAFRALHRRYGTPESTHLPGACC
jgi:hypothetical protein